MNKLKLSKYWFACAKSKRIYFAQFLFLEKFKEDQTYASLIVLATGSNNCLSIVSSAALLFRCTVNAYRLCQSHSRSFWVDFVLQKEKNTMCIFT